MYVCIHCVSMYVRTYIHVCALHTYMHVHVIIFMCMHICVLIHNCTYTYVCVHVFVCLIYNLDIKVHFCHASLI